MPEPRKVLVVEDDLAFAEFVRASIESLGHRTILVTSGSDAVEAYREHRPDLVFLDLLLPKKDGFAICQEIRACAEAGGATVPVVMMTGIYRKAHQERDGIDRCGANAYLCKPFGVREVWRVLEQHLGPDVSRGADVEAPAVPGRTIERAPLACLLADHLQRRSCGVLFVRGTGATFVVYLRDGAPVFVRSNDAADRLDRVLLRSGQASEAEVASALKACAESRGRLRLGDVLVERGVITREQLEVALQLQLRLILNRAFQADPVAALFIAGEHPTEEDVLLQGHPRAMLLRGARSTPIEAARAHLPAPSSTLVRVEGWEALVPELTLKEDETRLLRMADGATTVERFLATATVSGFDGPRILLALLCAGLACDVPAVRRTPTGSEGSSWDAGAFRGRPLGAAIADLHRKRASGELVAAATETAPAKRVVFRAGAIVAVESHLAGDRLAPMIAAMQLVEPEALETIDAEVERDDARLGRALVERELLSPVEVYWASVYRAHRAVHDMLAVRCDRLEWTSGSLATDAVTLPDVPTPELAWNGLRALDDEVVRELLPPGDVVLVAERDAELHLWPLDHAELAAWEAVGRGCRASSLAGSADEADAAEARRLALAFLWSGLARTGTDADLARSREHAGRPGDGAPRSRDFLDLLHDDAFAERGADADVLAFHRETHRGADAEEPHGCERAIDELIARLRAMEPVVRTLRAGFTGSEARVGVDRARMAELLDEVLAVTRSSAALAELLERDRERDAAGTTAS